MAAWSITAMLVPGLLTGCGTVVVWSANSADNEPLDADGTITISGGIVLAAGGGSGMEMNLEASQSCVIFGADSFGGIGGEFLALAEEAVNLVVADRAAMPKEARMEQQTDCKTQCS